MCASLLLLHRASANWQPARHSKPACLVCLSSVRVYVFVPSSVGRQRAPRRYTCYVAPYMYEVHTLSWVGSLSVSPVCVGLVACGNTVGCVFGRGCLSSTGARVCWACGLREEGCAFACGRQLLVLADSCVDCLWLQAAGVPDWVLVLLCDLAWNEIVAVPASCVSWSADRRGRARQPQLPRLVPLRWCLLLVRCMGKCLAVGLMVTPRQRQASLTDVAWPCLCVC